MARSDELARYGKKQTTDKEAIESAAKKARDKGKSVYDQLAEADINIDEAKKKAQTAPAPEPQDI